MDTTGVSKLKLVSSSCNSAILDLKDIARKLKAGIIWVEV